MINTFRSGFTNYFFRSILAICILVFVGITLNSGGIENGKGIAIALINILIAIAIFLFLMAVLLLLYFLGSNLLNQLMGLKNWYWWVLCLIAFPIGIFLFSYFSLDSESMLFKNKFMGLNSLIMALVDTGIISTVILCIVSLLLFVYFEIKSFL